MAFRYIFGDKQISQVTSKLSTSVRSMSSGILSQPDKMENIINIVRTAAPLTSAQTVTKVNTYLPVIEKTSTLLGMYSFLNRAQNYAPIEPLSGKSSVEKITSLMSKNKAPIGKMLAQPILSNSVEKVMTSVVKDMIKNGNLNDMLSSFSNQFANGNQENSSKNSGGSNNNIDFNSLLETFGPLLSNMMSTKENNSEDNNNNDNDTDKNNYNDDNENYDDSYDESENYNDHKNTDDQNNKHSINSGKNKSNINKKSDTYNKNNNEQLYEKPKPVRIRTKRNRG